MAALDHKSNKRGKSGLHGMKMPDNVRRGINPLGKVPQKTNRLLDSKNFK